MEKTLYVFAILSSILRSLVTKILIVSWVVYCLICLVWGIHACVWFMSRDFRGLPPEKQELFQAYRRLDIGQFSPVISVVGSLVLLPLRLLLSALLGILNLLLFSVVVKVLPRAYSRPGAKKPCRGYDSWTVRFLHFASAMINRSLLLIFGIVNINEHFTPETQRSERDIGHLTTVVANHVSVLDILYFMMRIFPAFVSKATVKTDPFFGPPAELLRCIFLDRSNPNDRLRALKDIKARQLALARQHSGEDVSPETIPPFLVFPEGTTTSGRHVAEFKQGAFVSLEAVTPVGGFESIDVHSSHLPLLPL
ncbi:MAG: uncharacterized protein KVP18_000150 [Porospora cf. gigantea A]|uniref:uncharacterized protein n=2 Tax=Porospora cf. gigantea A TaxID=2853593 RepID=UPI00355A1FB2|nr:MAG: hypothetical protein KVP18_000150 [Porospora cf. gigantea A]